MYIHTPRKMTMKVRKMIEAISILFFVLRINPQTKDNKYLLGLGNIDRV